MLTQQTLADLDDRAAVITATEQACGSSEKNLGNYRIEPIQGVEGGRVIGWRVFRGDETQRRYFGTWHEGEMTGGAPLTLHQCLECATATALDLNRFAGLI